MSSWCEVRHPGSRDYGVYPCDGTLALGCRSVHRRAAPVTFAERFSKQYRQFKESQQQTKSGTPLDYLTFLTEGKRAELRAINIYTAEALAIVDGAELKNLGPGGREMEEQDHRVSGEQQRGGEDHQA